jgi:hypothetical protein
VHKADRVGVGGVDEEHPRPHHVAQYGPGLGEGFLDDREAAAGLDGDVVGAGAVGEDGRGAGDEDAVADTDSPGEADGGLEGRAGADALARGHGRSVP